MSVYAVVQTVTLLLVLGACLLHLYARFAPESLRLVRGRLARRIDGDAVWRKTVAQRLRPPARVSLGCASTSACGSSCGGCGPSRPA
ncbi:MAG: hypothetical protein H7A20_10030 [Rhodanobacteraceae bacterium]|nr:hypothetical protein [Rhodanobacteraceae bacterium]HPF72311.1 hypothetical protein [Xanthomonadaceae bacterium]HRX98548.1 hypothetical protein [Xanthomonadaceae bacterium]